MTATQMWDAFIKENPSRTKAHYEAWCYGSDIPDTLAALTLDGTKTATASAYPAYVYEGADLPRVDDFNVIFDTNENAVCVTRTTSVRVVPFNRVSAAHAFMEGEGDRSLAFWREVHANVFSQELRDMDMTFTEDMPVVCEEFEVVYPTRQSRTDSLRIETARLILRPFAPDDAQALYDLKYDPEVLEYIPDFLERDVTLDGVREFIARFNEYDAAGDINQWRVYAITDKTSGAVIGSISVGMNELLHEYELGWQVLAAYRRQGYASEAAAMFAEYFCQTNGADYMIVTMDVDNPASYGSALKSGFKLFEKRTVYDYHYGRYCDDYYYFRRYYSRSALSNRYYGDTKYTGRGA